MYTRWEENNIEIITEKYLHYIVQLVFIKRDCPINKIRNYFYLIMALTILLFCLQFRRNHRGEYKLDDSYNLNDNVQ